MPPYSRNAKFTHKQLEPKENFDSRSFRTKNLGKIGKKATVGCPVGEWMPNKKKCKVGTRIQRIMTPIKSKINK